MKHFIVFHTFDIARPGEALPSFVLQELSSWVLYNDVRLKLYKYTEIFIILELEVLVLSEYQFNEALGSLLNITQRVYF